MKPIDNLFKKPKNINNESNYKTNCSNDQPCTSINEDSNSLSNSEAVTNENVHTPPDNSRQSDSSNKKLFSQDSDHMDLESSLEYDELSLLFSECDISLESPLTPSILNVRNLSLTPSTSSEKKKKAGKKISKAEADKGVLFILHTIDQYDKHLMKSDAFKSILKDESLALLSKWALESKDNKKVMSYLYCIDRNDEDIPMKTSELTEINYTSLYEKGFIIFFPTDIDVWTSEQCIELLTSSQMQALCEKFKWKPSIKNKESYKEIIRKFMMTQDTEFSNNSIVNRKEEVLKDLRSKVKKWKLSDLARETITELIVLMHLDNIFKMGCSIDSTKMYNDRPEIKFKPPGSTKTFPVDKKMILDNATIIFQDRKEFCTYLKALAFFEEYKTVKDKREIVLQTYHLYKEVTKENMFRYRSLPPWLRRFTPVNIYVEILEDGVKELKKLKEYDKTLEILDLLIAQVAFKQHNKAAWYDMKAIIQLKYLKSPEKAAGTLCEAFVARLPEETVNTLRHRAKQITEIKTRNLIDLKVLHALGAYAEREILERSIPDPHYYCRESTQKSNSRRRPQYEWKGELVSVETLCCNIYKKKGQFTLAEHWEGHLMNTIYFLLFWDIIYTKPLAIGGIFMSHYQQYPLDIMCESFYINRKAIIDDFLIKLENSTVDDIIKTISNRYDELVQYNVPEMTRKVNNFDDITTVVRCLGPRALAAICRRLAYNYKYMRYGFPDLTLCNTDNLSIEFREVKTDKDVVHSNQIQWLHYLNNHNIKAGFCYLSNKKVQDINQEAANEQHLDSSYLSDTTNTEDQQPDLSTSFG